MSRHLARARLLFQQRRPELAESELRLALAESPNDPEAHALLALCLVHREQWDEATRSSRQAIHLAPDDGYCHYVHAIVLSRCNRRDEALAAIREAIRIDPFDADYFALLAGLECERARWSEALAAAETGLAIEADHVACTNQRAVALVRLGRREEAGRTIDAALARNPEDAHTHANRGWTLLERRDPTKAMEHFREALRLDPESAWARRGIVEAMKARNIVYRAMLSFFFWMAKFDSRTQWLLMIGFLFGRNILASLAKSIPILEPLYWPIVVGYLVFAIFSWIAAPLFNLILRLDKFGRLALSPEQTTQSNLLAACLLTAVGVAIVPFGLDYAVTGQIDLDWPISGMLFLGLAHPVTNIHRCEIGWPRQLQAVIAAGLATLAAATTITAGLDHDVAESLFPATAWGLVLSTWTGAWLSNATVKHGSGR